MPVSFDKRNAAWRFRFRRTIAGQLVRSSKLLPKDWTRGKAEAFDRAESSRLYGIASGVIKDDPLIETAVENYLKANTHLRNWKKCAAELAILHPYYAGRGFSAMPDIAQEYAKCGLAPATIKNRLSYLRAACRWEWKRGAGDADPGARMQMPSVRNERQRYIEFATVNKLAAEVDHPDTQAVILLAFFTGLRWITELCPRTKDDIHKSNGITWINAGTTKNGAPRMIPVHPSAVKYLDQLPIHTPARTIYGDFRRACDRLEITNLRLHDLRHSLASSIISSGGTLAQVQAALGHVSVVSSKRYSHLYPESLKDTIWKIGKSAKKAA